MNENTNRAEPARVPVDRIIGANIHTLMWRNHDSQVKIAGMLGLSQGALSHKLRGKRPWTPTEIDYMAHHYRMDHGAIFTKLPDLDSNQEPAGFRNAVVDMAAYRKFSPSSSVTLQQGKSQNAVVTELSAAS